MLSILFSWPADLSLVDTSVENEDVALLPRLSQSRVICPTSGQPSLISMATTRAGFLTCPVKGFSPTHAIRKSKRSARSACQANLPTTLKDHGKMHCAERPLHTCAGAGGRFKLVGRSVVASPWLREQNRTWEVGRATRSCTGARTACGAPDPPRGSRPGACARHLRLRAQPVR